MGLVAFDTHKFVVGLQEAGMTQKQAEILSNTYTKVMDEKMASKTDLLTVKNELIEKLNALGTDFTTLKSRVDAFANQLETLGKEVTILGKEVASLKAKMDFLETKLMSLEGEVSDLKIEVSDLKLKVVNLTAEMRSGFAAAEVARKEDAAAAEAARKEDAAATDKRFTALEGEMRAGFERTEKTSLKNIAIIVGLATAILSVVIALT